MVHTYLLLISSNMHLRLIFVVSLYQICVLFSRKAYLFIHWSLLHSTQLIYRDGGTSIYVYTYIKYGCHMIGIKSIGTVPSTNQTDFIICSQGMFNRMVAVESYDSWQQYHGWYANRRLTFGRTAPKLPEWKEVCERKCERMRKMMRKRQRKSTGWSGGHVVSLTATVPVKP